KLLIDKIDLVHWRATTRHFPSLQCLVLKSSELLEEILFGVAEIPSLQVIELHYCSKSSEISAREIQEQIEAFDVVIHSDE
ncbi:hypothetical protein ACH5RR_030085, partial [Cinchona calisaya]